MNRSCRRQTSSLRRQTYAVKSTRERNYSHMSYLKPLGVSTGGFRRDTPFRFNLAFLRF